MSSQNSRSCLDSETAKLLKYGVMMDQQTTTGRRTRGQIPKRSFRMSDTDYDTARKAAEASGMSLSDFLRDAIRNKAKAVLRKHK